MSATRSTPRWERRPDDRPQELLAAAVRVFAQHGYRGARLEQVAEAAGVTKGTIYYYFRSKEDLFRQAIEHSQLSSRARLDTMFAGESRSLAERLRLTLTAAWRELSGPDGALVRLMIGEVSIEAPELFREWLAEGLDQGCAELAIVVREGQASGEFRADVDATAAARMFVSSVLMHTILQHHVPDDGDGAVERHIDTGVGLFLHALHPCAPARAA